MDDPDQGANTMNATFQSSFAETMQRLLAERTTSAGLSSPVRGRRPSSPVAT